MKFHAANQNVMHLYLQQIPKWWVWCCWICPIAWSLKGLQTSQFGDIEMEVTVHGERKAISAFSQSYFGYDYDDLGVVAVLLLAFPVVFAITCALLYKN